MRKRCYDYNMKNGRNTAGQFTEGNSGKPKGSRNKAAQLTKRVIWRRDRDSNPGNLAVQRFSRPPHSTTLPPLRAIKRDRSVGD